MPRRDSVTVVRSRRTRARLALIACVLWLVGVEIMPGLHEALHDHLAAHTHDGGGMVVKVSFGSEPTHRHADGTIHRGADPRPGKQRDTLLGNLLAHGQNSLEHHAAALQPTAAPIVHPLPVDRRPTTVVAVAAPTLVSRSVPEAAARGPPATARS